MIHHKGAANVQHSDASLNHPYRDFRIPKDAPFQLKPSPGKGWGVFATRRILRGTIILREKPLFFIPKPHENIFEQDLQIAFHGLGSKEKQQFLLLRDNASKPFSRMTEAFAENSFAIKNPSGHGLYLLHSRFNHSCIPNSKVPEPDDQHLSTSTRSITSFATRDIAIGEEITFCYNTDFECRTRDDRHRALRFICDCKACLVDTPFQKLSDMRRTILRGLQYLTIGEDLNGKKEGLVSPIIYDPVLKRAAEELSISLSARLIYNLLSLVMLEQEGLLDEFLVDRFMPGISPLPSMFTSVHNGKIARLAMEQQTWLGKFCVAFNLYGRDDENDQLFAMLLHMRRRLL